MTNSPRITVFMAAYNAGDFISESIQSVLEQTFEDFELLIVNDGSIDHTVQAIQFFTDDRIRLIHNERNMGLVYTRNRVLEEARGTYIAILDSDDVAFPDRLQLQYDYMITHPHVALCSAHAMLIGENGEALDQQFTVTTSDHINMELLFGNPFINSNAFFKTSVIKDLNGYQNYAPAEDFELFFRMSEKYALANIDSVLVKYRIHVKNSSSVQSLALKENELRIIKKMEDSLGMKASKSLMAIHFSLFHRQYHEYAFKDYLSLYSAMKVGNTRVKKFPVDQFNAFLFKQWYELLWNKGAKTNALPLLFSPEIFEWKLVNFKQIRKVFKRSLKSFFNA